MRKYLRFVSQSVLGMLGLSVYILADTFFIANYIGADGLASLNLALPIYGIINGTGLLIGIGGGVRYTLRHTRGNENADSVFTASLLMGAVLSFIYVLCGVFGAEHLARLLGASGTVLQPTTVYLKVCCLFSPFFILNNILTTFTRNDDAPGRAMAAMLTGSFANIMMDWYMVCVLNAGMLGAVLATGMSPIFGVAICLTRKRGYHIGKHRIFEEIPKISAAGFSAFIGEFSSTVVILIFNYLLLSLAGSTGVAAYGIIANVALVATAVLTGAAQGVQPLISIAFAEHDRRTLTKQTRRGVVTAVLLGALFTVGALLFPQQVTAVFSKGSAELTALAVPGPDVVLLKLSCERRESAAYRAVCGGGAQPGRGCFISFARRDLSCAVCGGACKYIRADGLVACRADGGGAFSALRALSFIPRKEKRKNSFAGGIKRGIIF